MDQIQEHFLWNCSQVNATEHVWWEVNINIGSGYGLVPDSTKPLAESMLIQIYVITMRQPLLCWIYFSKH